MPTRVSKLLTLAVILAGAALSSCKENPIDAAIDEALDFSGIFEASDGTEIELTWDGDEGSATVIEVGSSSLGIPLEVGQDYMKFMYRDESDKEKFRGYVRDRSGFLTNGVVVYLRDGTLEIVWPELAISGQTNWNKIRESSPPDDDDDDDDTPSADIVLLYNKMLEGDDNSSTYFTITVPSGTKRLVVETFEEDQWGHNLGDLFVSRGQRPVVHSEAPYRWTADKSSINPNREREVIEFTNPPAGTWHILLYGYHEYYNTSLKATISK